MMEQKAILGKRKEEGFCCGGKVRHEVLIKTTNIFQAKKY